MSKIQKINYCVDCNDYVECDIANSNDRKIPKNCPLPDYDWKEKLLEWIEKNKITEEKSDAFIGEGGYFDYINTDILKQKIQEM